MDILLLADNFQVISDTDIQTVHKKTDRQINKQTDRQINKQADRYKQQLIQTNGHHLIKLLNFR